MGYEWVDELVRGPVGAAFFVAADRLGIDADGLADPSTAALLAAMVVQELYPWMPGSEQARAGAVAAARDRRVLALTRAVAADERNQWWGRSLDRDRQLLLQGRGDPVVGPEQVQAPEGAATRWEIYAQKPLRPLVTSTELTVATDDHIRSGAHAVLVGGGTDWSPTYPIHVTRCHVAADARVYEVQCAQDWHQLVATYGDPATHPGTDQALNQSSGLDNGLAPTWSAVASDFDGVHLSFIGLLTALYTPVTTRKVGTTTLWGWEWESTYWLRNRFQALGAYADLLEPPPTGRTWI